MAAKAYDRGWEIVYLNGQWVYVDNKQLSNGERPCKRCGRLPTKEGYDACIGFVEGANSVCCGHGVENKILM